jgi:hypothetical protein
MKVGPYDLRFVEIFHELYAIEDYLNSIESQLPDLIEKEKEKAYQSMPKNDPIEWQQNEQVLYELIEDVLPRYFYNSIVVTLWAIFESATIEIAKEIKKQQSLPITLDDIRGDFLERTNMYFNHIVKFPIDVRGTSWQCFRKFYLLRNAIAHCNGRLDNIKNKGRDTILELSKGNLEIITTNGDIVCSSNFIRKTYSVVFDFLSDITERVKRDYQEPKKF